MREVIINANCTQGIKIPVNETAPSDIHQGLFDKTFQQSLFILVPFIVLVIFVVLFVAFVIYLRIIILAFAPITSTERIPMRKVSS